MARKSKIRFEWDFDRPGLLLAIKDKGKITWRELLEAINAHDGFQGRIFSMQFIVDRDRLGQIGWEPWDEEPKGDVWELWEVVDGEPCPLCGKLSRHTFCPDCGNPLFSLAEGDRCEYCGRKIVRDARLDAYQEPPEVKTMDCFNCGGENTLEYVVSRFNGHKHGKCTKCGMSFME